ncbi:hypothetical protein WN51_14268 [Melipona quadrifasciata]|uniref:Uncharacterized protein n=1 Tax=Melipona quadrifasciata TaxID=166423 RepID=A0A0M9A2N3_9HYME|nr:hypothetical protein WN51_14268 [Melipona quadrifasciata]
MNCKIINNDRLILGLLTTKICKYQDSFHAARNEKVLCSIDFAQLFTKYCSRYEYTIEQHN